MQGTPRQDRDCRCWLQACWSWAASHANSAQFTDIFYDDNDQYPLILVSKCGNATKTSGETDGANDAALFYRITETNGDYTCSLIQSTVLNANTYGSTWAIDNNIKILYCVYLKNGNYTIHENNPCYIATFNCPSNETIVAGTTVTFTEQDALTIFVTGQFTAQGGFALNGILYLGLIDWDGGDDNSIWLFDVTTKRILTKLKLQSSKECEGVCVYDNSIFVSQRTGTDTANTFPLLIGKYTFT